MKNKDVEFDYFEVWCYEKKEGSEELEEKRFNLESILKEAEKNTSNETTYDYRSEKARIQKVKYDEYSKVWEIQLLRLREIAPPGLAKDNGTYEIIKLNDGEYIGESVSLLYDPMYYILSVQRNYNAIPPSGVEEYFNKCINYEPAIYLKPKIAESSIEKITKGKVYRKISFGIAANESTLIIKNKALNQLLKELINYNGAKFNIDITLGNTKKDRTLNPGLSYDTLQELYTNSATTKLKANIRGVDDTKVEKLDLFDDRMKDIEKFEVSRSMPLTHERVYPILKSKYLTRRKNEDFK